MLLFLYLNHLLISNIKTFPNQDLYGNQTRHNEINDNVETRKHALSFSNLDFGPVLVLVLLALTNCPLASANCICRDDNYKWLSAIRMDLKM